MPITGKEKKEGNLDPSASDPAVKDLQKKDSDVLNEVRSGIERLTQILSTYLSSFEERLGKIEKQIGNLDYRLADIEHGSRKTTSDTGAIRVPSGLVQDATRTEPVITKKRPEAETPSIPTPTVSTGPPKPSISIQPPTIVPKSETRTPEVQTGSAPSTGLGPEIPTKDIPLSMEAPMAEHFFDELRTRITTKSGELQEGKAYQTTPEHVTPAATKQTAQVPIKEETLEKSEEDIKKVLQRLKDSIKKTE
jgi:vacuolar-type H+-ATPase subunit E/Vma4